MLYNLQKFLNLYCYILEPPDGIYQCDNEIILEWHKDKENIYNDEIIRIYITKVDATFMISFKNKTPIHGDIVL